MVVFLKGIILAKTPEAIIIENNDIGYEVMVTAPFWRATKEGQIISCYTHEYLRENSRELYGFVSLAELLFFRKLIGISGVGPKIALHVFSLGTLKEIQSAIAAGNISFLTAIPGIGQKTAQKIVLELKGKLDLTEGDGGGDGETIEALQSLGYSRAQAAEALRRISPEISEVGERVRAALRVLGQKVR
ncbi:Holliday junction branch migration protein RuvA [Candidatus Uhrbacteria bacterium]|nr:Holliday junction branch migration protein RuvA [Candidatus Uhrbacteria bacterium]